MKDIKYFNCSETHEINHLASKFKENKQDVVAAIKKLCKENKIKYSTHKEAEQELINLGFTKK